MPIGMKNGEIRSGPRSAMTRTLSNSVATPPSPEPRITPVRAASSPSSRPGSPAWSSAWRAPTSAELDVAVGPPDAPCGRGRRSGRSRCTSAAISRVSRDGSKASIVARRSGRRRAPPRSRRRPGRAPSRRPCRSRRRAAAASGQLQVIGPASPCAPWRRGRRRPGSPRARDGVRDREHVELGAPDLGVTSPPSTSMHAHDARRIAVERRSPREPR